MQKLDDKNCGHLPQGDRTLAANGGETTTNSKQQSQTPLEKNGRHPPQGYQAVWSRRGRGKKGRNSKKGSAGWYPRGWGSKQKYTGMCTRWEIQNPPTERTHWFRRTPGRLSASAALRAKGYPHSKVHYRGCSSAHINPRIFKVHYRGCRYKRCILQLRRLIPSRLFSVQQCSNCSSRILSCSRARTLQSRWRGRHCHNTLQRFVNRLGKRRSSQFYF